MKSLVLALALISINAQAEVKHYSLVDQKFSINVPENWKSIEDFMGTPLALFGPEQQNAPRAVILISPTGEQDYKGFFKHPPKSIATYKQGREEWLKSVMGEAKSFDSFKQEKWTGIESSSQLGYHYSTEEGTFYERSVYITCGGNRIVFVKSLVPSSMEKQNNPIVEKTIKSLKCEAADVKTAQN